MDDKNINDEYLEDEINTEDLDDFYDGSAPFNNYNQLNSRKQVDETIDEAGAEILTKMGVPKPIAKHVIKKNGGTFSPTNLPGSKLVSNYSRNKLASTTRKLNIGNHSDSQLKNRINQNRNLYNQQVSNYNQQMNNQDEIRNNTSNDNLFKSTLMPSSLSSVLDNKKLKYKEELPKGLIGSIDIPIAKVASVLGVIIALIVVIVIVSAVGVSEEDVSDLNHLTEVANFVKGEIKFIELSDKLIYMNLCAANDDPILEEKLCLASNPGKFFTHLKDLYTDYQKYKDINAKSVLLDTTLLLETISYSRTDSQLFEESTFSRMLSELDELAEAMVEKYQERGDLFYEETYTECDKNGKNCVEKKICKSKSNQIVYSANGSSTYYRIRDDKYVSYLKYGEVHENYKGETKIYDVDIHPNSASQCIPGGRSYKSSDVPRYVGH